MARETLGDKVVPKVLLEATHKDTLVRSQSLLWLTCTDVLVLLAIDRTMGSPSKCCSNLLSRTVIMLSIDLMSADRLSGSVDS